MGSSNSGTPACIRRAAFADALIRRAQARAHTSPSAYLPGCWRLRALSRRISAPLTSMLVKSRRHVCFQAKRWNGDGRIALAVRTVANRDPNTTRTRMCEPLPTGTRTLAAQEAWGALASRREVVPLFGDPGHWRHCTNGFLPLLAVAVLRPQSYWISIGETGQA